MDAELVIAVIGAIGTVISGWLVNRVWHVQATVNGHTARLEGRIEALQARLDDQLQAQQPNASE